MKIPYGMSSFSELRREGCFYADKTRFLPDLESAELGSRYLIFLRPRRFGKSLLISMLEHYYDLGRADQFDALFAGLAVHAAPTPHRGRYLVLTLDFSPLETDRGIEPLRLSFLNTVRAKVRGLLLRYLALPSLAALLGRLDTFQEAAGLLEELFTAVGAAGHQLYILVDEYDSFTNDLIAQGATGLYEDLVSSSGFVRSFYKAIKEGTRSGVVARLFMTGVSPITLDDLASGFNITAQLTHKPRFNALCGFTEVEIVRAVEEFLETTPELAGRQELLDELARYYNGYRFTGQAAESLFNPDMVLYYLMELRQLGQPPANILDINVRVDYTKLRRIATPPGGTQEWQLAQLEALLTGERVTGTLVERFGLRTMFDQQHFLSLLYCMGLITVAGTERGALAFRIPNLVIRNLHWDELAYMFRQQAGVVVDTLDLQHAVSAMAYDGDLEPFLTLVREKVLAVLSRRDYRLFNEKGIKLVLLTYLSLSPIYRPLSEQEVRQGYSDIFLALDRRFADAKYAWLIELKYCRTDATPAEIEAKRLEAEQQLERYLRDRTLVPLVKGDRVLRAASVVVQGGQAIHWGVVREV